MSSPAALGGVPRDALRPHDLLRSKIRVLNALVSATHQIVDPANANRAKWFKLLVNLINLMEPERQSVCAKLREAKNFPPALQAQFLALIDGLDSAFKPLNDICFELNMILPNLPDPQTYDAEYEFTMLKKHLQKALDLLV
jgi:hypothetical protein